MAIEVETLLQDVAANIEESSEHLTKEASGSEERSSEAKIYDSQSKLVIDVYKFEQEMELKRQVEEAKLKIEESKAKTEIYTMWAKVGIAAAEMASGIGLGVLYLKANLKYGGMLGKDAKKWFDDLKHIKL